MKTSLQRYLAALLVTVALLPAAAFGSQTCGDYGTTVEFLGSPSEAARQARTEEKLVFVLHVSGHFENPEYT